MRRGASKQNPIIRKGIKELAPNQELPICEIGGPGLIDRTPDPTEIVFTSENLLGKTKHGSSILDFPSLYAPMSNS